MAGTMWGTFLPKPSLYIYIYSPTSYRHVRNIHVRLANWIPCIYDFPVKSCNFWKTGFPKNAPAPFEPRKVPGLFLGYFTHLEVRGLATTWLPNMNHSRPHLR